MKLSRNCKEVLNTAIANKPTLMNGFYAVTAIANQTENLNTDSVQETCETLADGQFIRWGDKQHTAFRLNETGRNYKEFDRLEKRGIWANRIWAFILGALSAIMVAWLTGVLQL